MIDIKTCPTCGQKKLRQVCEDVRIGKKGSQVLVPRVTFLRCDACGEELFDSEANQKIDAMLFAHRRSGQRRKSA